MTPHTSASAATTGLRDLLRMAEILHDTQQQCDEDGCMIAVSRQALDETLTMIAALSTPHAEGVVLVPREPTKAMCDAGQAAHYEAESAVEAGGEGWKRFGRRATRAAHVYAAMIAAKESP